MKPVIQVQKEHSHDMIDFEIANKESLSIISWLEKEEPIT